MYNIRKYDRYLLNMERHTNIRRNKITNRKQNQSQNYLDMLSELRAHYPND